LSSITNRSFLFRSMVKAIRKNKTIFSIVRKILNKLKELLYKVVFVKFPVKGDMAIFCSHLGRGYSCNPKAIYETMLEDERFKNYKFVWAFKDGAKHQAPGAVNVNYGSLKYLYYLSISKYWIFNAKMPGYYIKKKGQVYLQTWHGTPLKKLGKDIAVGEDAKFYRSEMSREEMVKTYERDSARYDYFISPNKFSTEAFKSAFSVNTGVIIETGYPRNDILTNASSEYADNIKRRLGIPQNKKVVLYAPTWRDNMYDTDGYLYELKVDFSKWHRVLGDDYFIIYKPHYLIYNTSNLDEYKSFIFDASKFDEINELYLISDILVTDYSSVFFDYGVLKRPALFYMYDLEEYRDNLRGFYLDIYSDLPGPIIEKEDELLDNIINIDAVTERFKDQNNNFYDKFCSLEQGKSSKMVIDILMDKGNKKHFISG
jgi:CDP-glycerol glycerophosphotransferase